MAVSSPTGSATAIAITVAVSVPYTSGRTPNSPCVGTHLVEVRNSQTETSRKNLTVSSKRTTTIPTVVKMDRYAQAVSRTLITRSLASRARLLRCQSPSLDLAPRVSTANLRSLQSLCPCPTSVDGTRTRYAGRGAGGKPAPVGSRYFNNPWPTDNPLLRLLERRLQVAALGLALFREHGAGGLVLVLGPRLLGKAVGKGYVLGSLDEPTEVLLGEVEVHERLDRVVILQRLGAHVDKERAGEQVLAGADCLLAGRDPVDGERLEGVPVVLVVGVAEVPERVPVVRDALYEHVVVLAGLDVREPAGFLLVLDYGLVKELVGAGLRAGAVEADLLVGPLGVELAPLGDLLLGGGLPERLELVGGHVGREVVLRVDDHGDAVEGHRDLDKLHPVLLAHRHLLGHVYGPGGVGDLGVALAEGLEAVAGARAADTYARLRVLLAEQLRRSLGYRLDRARPLDGDLAGDRLTATATLASPAAATTAGGNHERQGQHQGRPHDEPHTRDPTQPKSSCSQMTKDFDPTFRAGSYGIEGPI